jgi:hypothetical protein
MLCCAHAGVVGCYKYKAQNYVFRDVVDPRINEFDAQRVEKFADSATAESRGFVRVAAAEIDT